MKLRLPLVAAALLVTSTSVLAVEPRIVKVDPASGSPDGGTVVSIQMEGNFTRNCLTPAPPPPPAVSFGNVFVGAQYVTGGVRATAPAHAAGTVDVQVWVCGAPFTAPGAFTYTSTAPGPGPGPGPAPEPQPEDYDRVLIPVFFFSPGAYGSQWTTSVRVHNAAGNPVTFARPVFQGDPSCPAACGCQSTGQIPASSTATICSTYGGDWGLLVYAPKSAADDLFYSVGVHDTSRNAYSAGTEIPVVRDSDLRSRIILPGIPANANFRTALRVYDPVSRWDGSHIRMQIFTDDGSHNLLVDRVVALGQPQLPPTFDPFISTPAFAFFGDLVPFTGVQQTPIRIELTPVAPLDRFWAFVSITNNITQEVTTVTPQ